MEQPNDVELEEYKTLVQTFSELMLKELIDNHHKGGRVGKNGWLKCNPRFMLSEIYYHTGKLQEAIKLNDIALVKEYSADIANLSMMMTDIHSLLIHIPFKQKFYKK